MMVWGPKQIMRGGNSLDYFCSLFVQELDVNRDGGCGLNEEIL